MLPYLKQPCNPAILLYKMEDLVDFRTVPGT